LENHVLCKIRKFLDAPGKKQRLVLLFPKEITDCSGFHGVVFHDAAVSGRWLRKPLNQRKYDNARADKNENADADRSQRRRQDV
jgi:hypothetical protein